MASSLAKDLCYLTIREAGSLIQRQELSPVELTTAHLQRIEELDGRLRSFVALQADEAMAEARVAEAEILMRAPIGVRCTVSRWPTRTSSTRVGCPAKAGRMRRNSVTSLKKPLPSGSYGMLGRYCWGSWRWTAGPSG